MGARTSRRRKRNCDYVVDVNSCNVESQPSVVSVEPTFKRPRSNQVEWPLLADCTYPTCAQAESGPPRPVQNQTPINQLESDMETKQTREPWNKGKLVGQKPPLKLKDIWAIRTHLQNAHSVRDLALFNIAIDSKLRGCDLVNLRVCDVMHGSQVLPRAMIVQRKTQRPVQFELTEPECNY